MRRSTLLALSGVSLATIAIASPAFGQAPPAPPPVPDVCAGITDPTAQEACVNQATTAEPGTQPAPAADGTAATPSKGDIVITGSRLRRDERTSADPVTVIDPNIELREGKFSTAEVLQSSPIAAGSTQITSTLSSNFVFNGGEGVETISLRGLGANRTLVLLNGRRAGPAGTRGGVSAFDLNVIPTEAIQSIDILKTGASSIYGSDAIAGVVNLITKKDLRGLQMRGFTSFPTHTGGGEYSISGIYGIGLGERGHVMIGAQYDRQAALRRGDRSFLGCEEENVTSEATGKRSDPIDPRTGKPYCGNFLNDVILLTDFSTFFGDTNLIRNGRSITAIQYNRPGTRLDEFLTPIDPAANFFQFSGPDSFLPVGAYSATGLALENLYNSDVDRDSIIPQTSHFTIFGEAGYDLTDRVSLYAEGLYNRRKTKTTAHRQLFFNQFTGNSVLPGFFCDGTTCDPNAPGDPFNTEFSGAQFIEPVIIAPFNSDTDVKYLRGVAGARADLDNILPHGFADLYFQHSRSDGDYGRDIIFRDAIQFGVAELRTNKCAGTVTAIRGVPCVDIDYTDPRVLAGNFTPEEKAFLFGRDLGNTLYTQNSGELSFGGDIVKLPAGAVKFALGGTLRRDEIRDRPGEATLAGNTFGSTSSGITAGYQNTSEAFGEIEIPILRNLPLVKDLTFNGAARVTSTYSKRKSDGLHDSDNGNWTYKLAANYSPTDWLRLRATKGTSFRSPALFEQFLANESGFIDQSADPCINLDIRLAAGSVTQQVYDNCRSQGIPGNYLGDGSSIESFSGGGIGVLNPETSKALTLGAIFTPQGWLWSGGQFSFSVDYIDINVKNQVTQLGATNILNACYSSESFPTDPLCSLFVRDTSGPSPSFNILTVQDPYLNIDQQRNKSLDFTTRFSQDLGSWGRLSMVGQATRQLTDRYTLFAGVKQAFNGVVGDPKWVADLNVTWNRGPLTLTYGLQVIDKTSNLKDLKDSFGSLLTENNCLATRSAFALRGGPYCPIYKLPRVAYHSLSAEIQATKDFSFLVGVSNLFDKKPPLVSTVGSPIGALGQVPVLASYYDYLGRRFFVSVRAKFGQFGL